MRSCWESFCCVTPAFPTQGEQCNVVPDTIDDIVADIGQEEKEEGTENTHTHTNTRSGKDPKHDTTVKLSELNEGLS